MDNQNYRLFKEAEQANEIAWRLSKCWPVLRILKVVQLILCVIMVVFELMNTVISRQYDIARCYYGVGFYASIVGAAAALVGIFALKAPWRRYYCLFAYFPLASIAILGAIAVLIFSIYCSIRKNLCQF
jgi:hypothetical protein